MDPYGRHFRHNDNTTKFRVIFGVYLLLKGRQALNLAQCHTVQPICNGWQQKQRRLTQSDQSDRTKTSVSHRGEQCLTVGMLGTIRGKADRQHKHSSKYFAYKIKCKIVIGIGTKIQSTPGPKHDQINTALIAHHLEVGTNWTLAESSAQFSLSSYVIVGRSNHLSTNEQFLVRWRK